MYLKITKNTFLIQNYFYNNAKKNLDKFWLDNRLLNSKILNYFNKI